MSSRCWRKNLCTSKPSMRITDWNKRTRKENIGIERRIERDYLRKVLKDEESA